MLFKGMTSLASERGASVASERPELEAFLSKLGAKGGTLNQLVRPEKPGLGKVTGNRIGLKTELPQGGNKPPKEK